MTAPDIPDSTDPAETVADFERRARCFETPCGDGVMVWRVWGSGPPVVLGHGSHGSWAHWIRNIDALAAEYTVWVPDFPGCGDSAMPPRADNTGISDVVAEGLRMLFPPEELPIDVVAFSYGALLMAYVAFLHPGIVRRLVVVGPGGLNTPRGPIRMRRLRGLEGEERRTAHRDNLLSLMLHNSDSADDLALYIHEINGARGRFNPAGLVLPDKMLELLPALTMQFDAIWGEFDRPHPDPALHERILREIQPDIEFRVIPGAGHWSMYERPDAFNRAALDILRQPLRPPLA
jgi:pimeloyl-ACP methyl ester carboxylesterase